MSLLNGGKGGHLSSHCSCTNSFDAWVMSTVSVDDPPAQVPRTEMAVVISNIYYKRIRIYLCGNRCSRVGLGIFRFCLD